MFERSTPGLGVALGIPCHNSARWIDKRYALAGMMRLALTPSHACLLRGGRGWAVQRQALPQAQPRAMSATAAEAGPGSSSTALAQKRCVPCESNSGPAASQCEMLSREQADALLSQARCALVLTRLLCVNCPAEFRDI
jgi:hypothetical protein